MNISANTKIANSDLYAEVAEELDVSEHLVKNIVKAHSNLIVKIIKTGALESITLPYLGKIKVNHWKAQKIQANQGKKHESKTI